MLNNIIIYAASEDAWPQATVLASLIAKRLRLPFTCIQEHSMSMNIGDLLFEHMAKSISFPKKSLACL